MKICLIIQLYYSDLYLEFIDYIDILKSKIKNLDVYVDITRGVRQESEFLWLKAKFENIGAIVYNQPNLGKDIGSFLSILNDISNVDYDFIIKLHTKKSIHTCLHNRDINGELWRKELIQPIIDFDYTTLEKNKCYFPKKFMEIIEQRYKFENSDISGKVKILGCFDTHYNGYIECAWASPHTIFKFPHNNTGSVSIGIRNNHIKSNEVLFKYNNTEKTILLDKSEYIDVSFDHTDCIEMFADYFIPKQCGINDDIRTLSVEIYRVNVGGIITDGKNLKQIVDKHSIDVMNKIGIIKLESETFCGGTMFIYILTY